MFFTDLRTDKNLREFFGDFLEELFNHCCFGGEINLTNIVRYVIHKVGLVNILGSCFIINYAAFKQNLNQGSWV